MTANLKSTAAQRALNTLGADLKTARKKRRMSVNGFADRMSVSESTLIRLEKGDAGVSIGALAMACLVLGEINRVSEFLDPGSDDTGLLLERDALPKRIDEKRKSSVASDKTGKDQSSNQDDEGVGF